MNRSHDCFVKFVIILLAESVAFSFYYLMLADYLDMVEVPIHLSLIQMRLRSNYYTNK